MIIDTSVLIAILRGEPDAMLYRRAVDEAATRRVSAGTFIEAAIVVDANRDPVLSRRLDQLLEEANIVTEPVTVEQARIAREAHRDFGRGSGHPARLNFGDCFAYALARSTGEPLLFKGLDFAHTDLTPAVLPAGGSPPAR